MNIEKEFKKFKKLMPDKSDEDIYKIIYSESKHFPEDDISSLGKKVCIVSCLLIVISGFSLIGYGLYVDDLVTMVKVHICVTVSISVIAVNGFKAFIQLTRDYP